MHITGNSGYIGGGIAVDGTLIIGQEPEDPSTGDLTVTNIVSGSDADGEQEFTYTVTAAYSNFTAINGTYGDMTFVNGVATFTLKGGESTTATGIPAGVTYTVTESDNSGYTVTITVDGEPADEAAGKIVADESSTVVFNNYKDSSGDDGSSTYTSVTVNKVWVTDDGGTAANSVAINLLRNGSVYTAVTLSEDNNWTYTWSNLNDSYTWTVEEADVPEGFISTVAGSGTVWTITNDDAPDDSDEPEEPDEPDEPDTPDEPDSPDTPDNPSGPDSKPDDTPKTGGRYAPCPLAYTDAPCLYGHGGNRRYRQKDPLLRSA